MRLPFTVDSALLKELGERLVGKPHIALAELVKNSYDADATTVVINFNPNSIDVCDNGHGMSFDEFRDYWMRIGSPHKTKKRLSRNLKRPMTGSKGVGRLAVQFLARRLTLRTVAESDTHSELVGSVNWDQAVQAGLLTQATATVRSYQPRRTTFPEGRRSGTAIVLDDLNQPWTPENIEKLAREIWWLQPPFRPNPRINARRQQAFVVQFRSPQEDVVERFDRQMQAIMDIWQTRIIGKLCPPDGSGSGRSQTKKVLLSLEHADGSRVQTDYPVPDCRLHSLEFEIRIYNLERRQPSGIKVGKAREYLAQYGGIHIYDAGFHLPYYGIETDWLRIEMDHSHRLSRSKLLPDELQVQEGMNYLPTQSRILGVVHVDTPLEAREAKQHRDEAKGQYLKILITRDRLEANEAFESLTTAVRYALDFYAMQEAQRAFQEIETDRGIEPVKEKVQRVEEVLESHREEIPGNVYDKLQDEVREVLDAVESDAEKMARQAGLLGSLATAGISAVAMQHELNRQLSSLEHISATLRRIRTPDKATQAHIHEIASELSEWLQRATLLKALFGHLTDPENREKKASLNCCRVVEDVKQQMSIIMRGIEIDTTHVDKTFHLPPASFADWSAILQNVFINAANAIIVSGHRVKRITVSSRIRGRSRALMIQDTGCGIDLDNADVLFEPFERKLEIPPERRSLGLGGSGLGLTIVRMIAFHINCKVRFVEPEEGYNTAFQLSWSE